jgi:hypothetical protein
MNTEPEYGGMEESLSSVEYFNICLLVTIFQMTGFSTKKM